MTVDSDLPLLPDFGPGVVNISLGVSANTRPDSAVYSLTLVAEANAMGAPGILMDMTNTAGELEFSMDLSAVCGSSLILTLPGSINPEDTINVAALSTDESCQGLPVSVDVDEFTLTELLP